MKVSKARSVTLLVAALSLAAVVSTQAKGKHNTPTQSFSINANTRILVTGVDSPTLANIQVGDKVSVAYTGSNDVFTATEITDHATDQAKGDRKAGKRSGNSQNGSVEHAGGVVTSVDTTAQTLIIKEEKHKKQQ